MFACKFRSTEAPKPETPKQAIDSEDKRMDEDATPKPQSTAEPSESTPVQQLNTNR